MDSSTRFAKIRIKTGKPKRQSGVYVRVISWGVRGVCRQKAEGSVINLNVFQWIQLEEGPTLFDGLEFKLIPV